MGEGRILLLGGTGEARELAGELVSAGIPVVSSLAGRVRDPRLPVGDVRIGGFGGVDGLVAWLREHEISGVVDATHPFAQTMTDHAAAAAQRLGTPLLRLRRPPWEPDVDDSWQLVSDIGAAARTVGRLADTPDGLRVFLTTGRQDVAAFSDLADAWFLIRVVDPPTGALPPRHQILRSRGPYDLDRERDLMRDNGIDVLVTKNSGGELTRAKLTAAAELGIRVVMVQRPPEPAVGETVGTTSAAVDWVVSLST
ncbi:cobalt-precorrin-6A reductase [Gordonia sp. LSe1-13]|uniref:Cobalt-precorrin-6A reductase n=1 Tax=Gordonia sesuvii TaxID=3116777 RepID=A0ABU7MB19_9ACTN|nr:cobalt-precorrin-6A reductase [Gordonia sp. LSe1-13]